MLDIQLLRNDLQGVINRLGDRGLALDAATFERIEASRKAVQMRTQELQARRNQLSKEDAERRLAAQWPIEKKVEKATFVIRTDGTFDETNEQVDKLIALFTAGKTR